MTRPAMRRLGILALLASFIVPGVIGSNAVAQDGFPLTANTAFCEPGYFGPFDGCTPWDGVTVTFVAMDQEFSESCVTVAGERTASCTVSAPFGSTIVASIDPSVVPAGSVLEGPATLEIAVPDGPPEGVFGGPAFVLLPAAGEEPADPEEPAVEEATEEPVVQPDAPAPPVAPVDDAGMPAGIQTGACTDGDLLEPVVQLNGPRLTEGTAVGSAEALPVASAYTVVDLAFDDLLNGAYVVTVYDEDDPETLVACGAIGGVPDANGALSIGLAPVGDAGLVGVAYLSAQAGGTATGISLFVVEGLP